MAHKKPGVYVSRGYAIHNPRMDQWVSTRVWGYLSDGPERVAGSEKTARRVLADLPNMIADSQRNLQDRIDLVRGQMFHQQDIEWMEQRVQRLRDLLAGPLELVEITSETTITHRRLP